MKPSLKKQLFHLAAPIFIETLLIMLLGTTDIIMLSRHSDATVAAVGEVTYPFVTGIIVM